MTCKEKNSEKREYYFSRKLKEIEILREAGIKVNNLAIGNPDLPPPAIFSETLRSHCGAKGDHGYQPHRGIRELRQAFSEWYWKYLGVSLDPETECLPLMGSKEGIGLISEAHLKYGDEVLIPDPAYPFYSLAAEQLGAISVPYSLTEKGDWLPDIMELDRLISSATKILWMNYPHMPSGMMPDKEKLKQVVKWAHKRGILIVNDNPYVLNTHKKPFSIFQISGSYPVLELTSLSKAYHLAGWRVGVVCGNRDVLRELEVLKSRRDSGMPKAVQLAAASCLQYADTWLIEQQRIYTDRRNQVEELAKTLDCKPIIADAGLFVWAAIPASFSDAEEMSDYLLDKYRLFVAPGSVFGKTGEGFIRISLCANNETIQNIINITQTESHE